MFEIKRRKNPTNTQIQETHPKVMQFRMIHTIVYTNIFILDIQQ